MTPPIVVTPLVVDGAWALGSMGFSSCGAQTQLPHGRGIFLDQGLNQCPLHCRADS